MTTFHRVTGPLAATKICRAVGCWQAGLHRRNGAHYCAEHYGPIRGASAISPAAIRVARELLGAGQSLRTVAGMLKVQTTDLDQALWRHIGDPLEDGAA